MVRSKLVVVLWICKVENILYSSGVQKSILPGAKLTGYIKQAADSGQETRRLAYFFKVQNYHDEQSHLSVVSRRINTGGIIL